MGALMPFLALPFCAVFVPLAWRNSNRWDTRLEEIERSRGLRP